MRCASGLSKEKREKKTDRYVVGDGLRDGTKFEKVAILMVWGSRCESWFYRGKNE